MILGQDFIRPRYDRGGFASIPGRIREHLASGICDAVVLFLVDGFGWRFLQRFQNEKVLKRLVSEGTLEQLTAQFPATTAAHVTTVHTDLPVGQHGVYEWFYYEPQLDRMIAPLLFSFAGDRERDTLKSTGLDPRLIFPSGTFYSSLAESGVASYVFGVRDYTPSTYSNVIMQGAVMYSFKTFPEALVNLGGLLGRLAKPAYVHLYFDKIDALCHEYGPASPQVEAEIEVFLWTMEHFFERIFKTGKRVLFLMTADHGAAEVDPATTVFLNEDPRFAGIERFFKSNAAGELLVPAGSPRDMFLYIKDDLLDEAQAFLQNRLDGRAEAVQVAELVEAGYFGPRVSPQFLSRVGNLVLLAHRRQSVWWYVKNRFEQRYYGHHGSLTPEELEIPLFSWSS
jgi:predicted AlkP superfamily pyrophosphatase or phosphodiesterase